MNNPNKNRGRRFDEEFKRSVAEMAEQGDRSVAQLAVDLGISAWSIYQWMKRYGKGAASAPGEAVSAPAALSGDVASENARLRRELEAMTRQRDILKKACAILGQDQGSASR